MFEQEEQEAIVPVMRRHGEPLMVMPDWKHLDAADSQNRQPSSRHLQNLKEKETTSISSEERFEAEAHRKAYYRGQQRNSIPVSDRLAFAGLRDYYET